jgi:uncharacterized protein YjdB
MFRNRPIALTLVLAAIAVMAFGTLARAQASVAKGAAVTVHATITAIDATNRIIELKTDDGSYETVYAGPEVKRFAELKVGQKVTFSYYESVVFAIQKADDKTKPGENMKVERSTGATPGGMLSQRVTTVVTVNEVKPSVPSITVTTEDGRKVSFKVEDARNLEGVKAGDKVKITYTQALAIAVK